MSIIIALYEDDHWLRIFILFCLRNRNYYVILEKAPTMKSQTSIKLFELSQEFIPDKKKAGLFVQKIEETIDDKMEHRHEHLATKTDLADLKVELKEDISALQLEVRNQKVELMEVITQQKVELMGVIKEQKAELMVVINGQKADLTKSIYFMGLVQFLAIMGGVLAIVSLMLK